jgi:hypothetical protein
MGTWQEQGREKGHTEFCWGNRPLGKPSRRCEDKHYNLFLRSGTGRLGLQ